MNTSVGVVSLYILVGCSVLAGTTAEIDSLQTAKRIKANEVVVIDCEEMLGRCLESVQWQYLPVSLPSLSARLLQPAGSFPVDFFGFDPAIRKLFQGRIDEYGIVRYTVGLYEDYWSGEIVVQNDLGREIFRIQREKSYDPYDYQRALFGLREGFVLEDDFSRRIFLPSKISTVVDLVPLVFWEALLEAEQKGLAARHAARFLVESKAARAPLPAVVARVETLDDGTVLVQLEDPDSDASEIKQTFAMTTMAGSSMLDQTPVDGLSDVWVREMAGGVIDPLDSDLDGDGMNFQAEHDLGLNPNVANPDFFKIMCSELFNPARLALELNDVQGVDYELDESYDLMGNWLYIPLALPGNTNRGPYIVLIPDSAPKTFWRIRPAGFQNSGDDLLNDFEEYLLGTSINHSDSDGDGLGDAWEFINHLDPASIAGANGALGDGDNDGFSNLEEQAKGTDPHTTNANPYVGTLTTIRYYYDDDNRLTDSFVGIEVAEKYSPSSTHNLSEVISVK